MNTNKYTGKVILAGAGPGDPELITLKALKWLQQADVILADRLVSTVLIKQYVKPGAEIVFVGKQGGRAGSTPQEKINDLLLRYAVGSNIVLRLKGGDVSIFSNILDELETLTKVSIPFEIIPGITAAMGAAAYAGIPLTARGLSTAVRFLTYYRPDLTTDEEWKNIANTGDTLVWYMSARPLNELAARLKNFGMDENKPVAVIEQATTPFQKITFTNLIKLVEEGAGMEVKSPALLIMGDVVSLHNRFEWFTAIQTEIPYFDQVPATAVQPLTNSSDKNNSPLHAARV
jgi:uroporphyrin-III C-methyltransferase